MVLLIIEVIALIGLLAIAVRMWNVRQELQQDLLIAKQAEAVLRAGEQAPGNDGQIEDGRDTPAAPSDTQTESAEDDGPPSSRGAKEARRCQINVSISGIYCLFYSVLFAP
ncbi:MAG: hypothetical protein R3248_14340 [Candidatus Promineifilaceae bacterium]|nr:hypothetical protein [Candidatus Promineifilaceae bacterium]